MSRRRRVVVPAVIAMVLPAVLFGPPAAALSSAPTASPDKPAFRLRGSDIVESSALVVSRSDPRLVFTVNDSGDGPRVYTVDTRTGETVGVTTLAGVDNVDFEALAFAPGGGLLVGDIGDNDADRSSVQVHLIDEPGRGVATVQAQTLELTYVDGPRDAEAVLVHEGRVVVVSKRVFSGQVYRGPPLRRLPGSGPLRPVAKAPGLVTDATVLGDGRVVLRNYTAAFVMTPAWKTAQTIPLPPTELGESSAAPPEGSWFYAGTEGEQSPVYRIDVPERTRSEGGPDPSAPAPSEPAPRGARPDAGLPWPWVGGGAAFLLVGAAALVLRQAVRRAGDRVRRGRGRAG